MENHSNKAKFNCLPFLIAVLLLLIFVVLVFIGFILFKLYEDQKLPQSITNSPTSIEQSSNQNQQNSDNKSNATILTAKNKKLTLPTDWSKDPAGEFTPSATSGDIYFCTDTVNLTNKVDCSASYFWYKNAAVKVAVATDGLLNFGGGSVPFVEENIAVTYLGKLTTAKVKYNVDTADLNFNPNNSSTWINSTIPQGLTYCDSLNNLCYSADFKSLESDSEKVNLLKRVIELLEGIKID